MLLAIGAMLWLLAVVGDAAHGILMFPVLKPHSERIAFGYLGARLMDAVFVGVMALLILFQIPLGSEYLKAGAPTLPSSPERRVHAGAAVCLPVRHDHGRVRRSDAVLPCSTGHGWFRGSWPSGASSGTRSFWAGRCWKFWGSSPTSIHAIPGGLWELFIGVWLIVKGFSPPPVPRADHVIDDTRNRRLVGSATA